VGRDEPLEGLHSSEPLHGAFPSSEGQVAVLDELVEPEADFLSIGVSEWPHRRATGAKAIALGMAGQRRRLSRPNRLGAFHLTRPWRG